MHPPLPHQVNYPSRYLMPICHVPTKNSWLTIGMRAIQVLLLVFVLSSCAGKSAFEEGQALLAEGKTEQGFAKMEEAIRLDPKNTEYRLARANRRATFINQLISSAEIARRDGRFSDAEKAYRQVQVLDSENAMARQGMEALTKGRRHQLALIDAEALLKKGSRADLDVAYEKLRSILAENPSHKSALNLKSRIDELYVKDRSYDAKLAENFKKPISLEFRDAPLKSVLEVISKVSGLNFFYDKEVRPDLKVTVFTKNISIEDAMRVLLVTNQLEIKILNENSILVYPNTPQKIKDYQPLVVRSFYLTNADVKAVSNSIKTILKSKDIVIDERLGIIIIRDTPEAIRMAERIVRLQDISDPEVMLEVEVMEIKRSTLLQLGVQWPSQLTLAPLQIDGAPLTLDDLNNLSQSTTQASLGSLIINARKEDQYGNILANPRIRVRNKEKAKIQIGDRVPAITTTSTSTGFVSESINYIDVGLKLEVEPTVYLDEEVAIKINLEVSNLVREVLSKSGTLAYQIGTRGANTVLRLKDGETQVLAGLISDEDRTTANKVPVLGDLPVAGRLFGSQKDDNQSSEILLSITPRIVRSIQRPDLLDAEFESGTESNVGAQTLRLGTLAPSPIDGRSESAPNKLAASPISKIAPEAAAARLANGEPRLEPVSTPAVVVGTGSATISWQAPAQVRVGEQFSALVRINSAQALRGLPVLLGFDPQMLQVVNVEEGSFFKQGNGQTDFSHRIDPVQGKVFATLVRQAKSSKDTGVNGIGDLVRVNFKAIKGGGSTRLQLLSAAAEPPLLTSLTLPIEQLVKIVP